MDDAPKQERGVPGSPEAKRGLASAAELQKPRRRLIPRFSLRSLTLCVLLAASSFGLWWNWEPWEISLRLGGHAGKIRSVTYSPDGSKVLTFGDRTPPKSSSLNPSMQGVMSVWDGKTGERMLSIDRDEVTANDYVYFAKDGSLLFACSRYYELKTQAFDAATGNALLPDGMWMEVVSPNERWALVLGEKRAPEVWDLNRRERLHVLDGFGEGPVHGCFSQDGLRMAVAGKLEDRRFVVVFDTESGSRLGLLDIPIKEPLAFTPVGAGVIGYLASGEPHTESFIEGKSFEVATGPEKAYTPTCLLDWKAGRLMKLVADAADYRPPLAGGQYLLFQTTEYAAVRDANTLEVKIRFADWVPQEPATSADGTRIVTSNLMASDRAEANIHIFGQRSDRALFSEWDLAEARKVNEVELPGDPSKSIRMVAFTKSETRIVGTTWQRTAVWDAGTGANRVDFDGTGYPSPDGRRILLWAKGEALRFGDMNTGTLLAELPGTASVNTPVVAFHPSGERVTVVPGNAENEAQVWERRRDEGPWGIVALPEFWLALAFALALAWSLVRDFRMLRKGRGRESR